ncbi:MAG: hypothetical protein JNM04_05955 [Chthonomonas sp.]|nr:hypothetical protein [Chthonomonas sp.]
MTATRKIIISLEDLLDYLREVSRDQFTCLGVAVMSEKDFAALKLAVTPDPFEHHKYGHLHVLGPQPGEMTGEIRKQLAFIATQSGWSRPPSDTPCV